MDTTLSVGQAVKITVGYLKGKQAYIQALHTGPDGDCATLRDAISGKEDAEFVIKAEYLAPDA